MRAALRLLATFVVGIVAFPLHAEMEASLDLRLVDSNGRPGFLDGGLGKLRFDADDDGLNLGRARLAWRGSVGGDWHATVDLSAWSLEDHHIVDLTEAWLEWRPVPQSAWRSNVKIGAFYPPVSLEHRAPGWSNPYTISSSALNTWIGEELRTIGVGYELEYLGQQTGSAWDFGLNAALYGWNDPAGIIIALRGFAMHDRQTPVFGRIGSYAYGRPDQRVLFAEIDNRVGYYVGGYAKHDFGIELRALHYDNRADPSAFMPSIDDYAWDTRFDSLGLRYDSATGTTLILQWLEGRTDVGPGAHDRWQFEAAFILLAQQLGAHRLAVRLDDFSTQQNQTIFPGPLGDERGDALTLGWTWAVREHLEIAAEWLEIRSRYNKRAALGEPAYADERLLQLALRWTL